METSRRILWAWLILVVFAGVGFANWADSFDGGKPTLTTWKFLCYPQLTGTFTQGFPTSPDGTPFLAFKETSAANVGGAQFGVGFGTTEEFTDVRVGTVVNVTGDASRCYQGIGARATYFMDPDGSLSGAPGVIASCYVMHINWDGGPANLRIDIEKVVTLKNIMRTDFDAVVPGLANARSFYAELDVVGSGPVYITGSLYESKGGPLLAQVSMVDTSGNDSWEKPDVKDDVYPKGVSGVFAQNEHDAPPGFYVTFDDISSASDGPAAVALTPAPGATEVSLVTRLSWVEAGFATGRELWFGSAGNMHLVAPAPADKTFDPGTLRPGQAYEWRVDEVGPKGVVQGHTWGFTTGQSIAVEDFESYATNAQIAAAWVDNIAGFDYVFLETGTVNQGAKSMLLKSQNQFEPFLTEATLTFAAPQDWTLGDPTQLSLTFRGKNDNVEQRMYVRVEAGAKQVIVEHPLAYAPQTESWRSWDIPLGSFAGLNMAAIEKLTIGVGNGTKSGQVDHDEDVLYIDNIRLSALTQTR